MFTNPFSFLQSITTFSNNIINKFVRIMFIPVVNFETKYLYYFVIIDAILISMDSELLL